MQGVKITRFFMSLGVLCSPRKSRGFMDIGRMYKIWLDIGRYLIGHLMGNRMLFEMDTSPPYFTINIDIQNL